jgi:hypothetical protein
LITVEFQVVTQKKRIAVIGIIAVAIADLMIVWGVPALKRKAASINCRHQIRSIGLVGLIWADDHGGYFPSNFTSMSNELNNPRILICPSDRVRHAATNFSSLKPENCSYEIVNPGIREDKTNGIFVRCKVHGFVVYVDGSTVARSAHNLQK